MEVFFSMVTQKGKKAINLSVGIRGIFLSSNVNCISLYVIQAVGNKLRIRELMSIASVEEHNDHVISGKKYKNLQESVKKAVYAEIGKLNSLPSIFHFASKFSFGKNFACGVSSKNSTL